MDMDHEEAFLLYNNYFRGYREIFLLLRSFSFFAAALVPVSMDGPVLQGDQFRIDSLLSDHAGESSFPRRWSPLKTS